MSLIIDGYNLLNAATFDVPGPQGATLHQTRAALLDFLAGRLERKQRRATIVVFDARHAPPGLSRVQVHREMTVRFAPRDCEADDVIEELIRANTAPRQLTVVSSDHRVQRAARRRRAQAWDSATWFRRFAQQPRREAEERSLPSEQPPQPVEDEPALQRWLKQFGDSPQGSKKRQFEPRRKPSTPPRKKEANDADHPFPPGYAEDLLD